MKAKIKVPYSLKKIGLGAMVIAMPILNSCEKDPDPVQERIKELTALEKVQANEVRAAVQPAKTVESDITSYFNMKFNNEVNLKRDGVQPTNLRDSSDVFVGLVEAARIENGNPLPHNETTMTNLYNKSKTYIVTFDELKQLLQGR
jgi:hypothetical protein